MGAGAFVMVELTGVPYNQIVLAALPPGDPLLPRRMDRHRLLRHPPRPARLPADERPPVRTVLITAGFFLVPFTVLLVGMFWHGVTPQYAATASIIAGAALLLVDGRLRLSVRQAAARVAGAALMAGRQVATIAAIILCASIVVGVLGLTGLGVKVTSLILSGSGGALWPALILTAIACLILGMEVPTTAAYVICVSVAGPALVELGLVPLQAHLFVFWFALLSTITPPVCGAVFIAAGMVGENWLKVAGAAMALGIGLYLIPLGMVASPGLLALDTAPLAVLAAFAKTGAGLAAVSRAVIARDRAPLRAALFVAGLALIVWPMHWGIATEAVGQ
ncbi:MAG: hypothetical protein AcusKO_05810 [Acuticoccus sp.]